MPLPEEEEEEERGSVGLAGWRWWGGGPRLGLVGAGSGTGWIQYTGTHTRTHARTHTHTHTHTHTYTHTHTERHMQVVRY